jgi:hypothetical protein
MNPAFRVAFVHYHFRPGGVTNVIRRAADALRPLNIATTVLFGRPPAQALDNMSVCCLEGLDYDQAVSGSPDDLADRMKTAAEAALGGAPDIWHIHNHALGKNLMLPAAVVKLAREGHRILLQIHDFAEDGRPANYKLLRSAFGPGGTMQTTPLYPHADHIHYAVLNRRDQAWLGAIGAESKHVHWLPNSVPSEIGNAKNNSPTNVTKWVYPTRAIRRKNIGEFLLWAALARKDERYAVTLAPTNPGDCAVYERWKTMAAEWKLPVDFGTGLRPNADPWWQDGSGVVTTSVAEGFGMAFLEPWMAELPLVGRDLPDITCDLKSLGIDLSMLYSRLGVPLKWIDAARLRNIINSRLRETWSTYGREPQPDATERAWQAAVQNDLIDFGRLDEGAQENVIGQLRQCATGRDELHPSCLSMENSRRAIAKNLSCVQRQFNPQSYGNRLMAVYQDLLRSKPGIVKSLPMDAMLDQALNPERFNLLRT